MRLTHHTLSRPAFVVIGLCGIVGGCAAPAPPPRVSAMPTPGELRTLRATPPSQNATNANAPRAADSNSTRASSDTTPRTTNPATDPAAITPLRSTSSTGMPLIPGTDGNAVASTPAWSMEAEDIRRVSFAVEGSDFDPCLTPDGRHIVFASTQHSSTSNIYVKSVTGLAVTQVTSGPANDVMPSVSPDGKRIAFSSDRNGNWDVLVIPFDGGRIAHLTTDPSPELHPTWSPDGKRLAFCRLGAVSGRWEIWVTEPDNPGVAQFVTHGMFPQWCPIPGTGAQGADQILFQRSRDRGNRAFSVWTVDYRDGQTGATTEIVSHPGAACINPTWSPDGQWVVFAMVPGDSNIDTTTNRPSRASLWMVNAQGGSLVGLAAGQTINLMPAWGRDNTIYFVSNRGGTENIWSLSAASALAAAGRSNQNTTLTMPVETKSADGHGPGH